MIGKKWRKRKARFNTQPPEGGWLKAAIVIPIWGRFNTQPPEGGWLPIEKMRP